MPTDLVTRLIATLQIYMDIENEHQLKVVTRTGAVDRNDRTDLTQLLYLHDGNVLFTGDDEWRKLAVRCGHEKEFRVV